MQLSNGNQFRTHCCVRLYTRNSSSKNRKFAEVVTSSCYSRPGRVDSRDCKRRPDLHCPSIYSAVSCEEFRSHILPDGTFNKHGRPRLDPACNHSGAPVVAEVDPNPAASPASGGRGRGRGEGRGHGRGSGRVQVAAADCVGSDDGSSPAAAQVAPAAGAARPDAGGNAPAAAQLASGAEIAVSGGCESGNSSGDDWDLCLQNRPWPRPWWPRQRPQPTCSCSRRRWIAAVAARSGGSPTASAGSTSGGGASIQLGGGALVESGDSSGDDLGPMPGRTDRGRGRGDRGSGRSPRVPAPDTAAPAAVAARSGGSLTASAGSAPAAAAV